MYLIDCPTCRTHISDEARICPRCGSILTGVRLPRRIRGEVRQRFSVETGESDWQPRSV